MPSKNRNREKTLEATEMDFRRRAAGRLWLERITCERIGEIMEISNIIVDDIKTKLSVSLYPANVRGLVLVKYTGVDTS